MERKSILSYLLIASSFFLFGVIACKQKEKTATDQSVPVLTDLKRGDLVACGPPEKEFGSVEFASGCSEQTKKDFDLGVALLHSFEYDESEKVFAKIIDADPKCVMAYWGVAMSNYHQVWPSPPLPEELKKGAEVIAIAQRLSAPSEKEKDYINSIATFYKDYTNTDHKTRVKLYQVEMEKMYKKYGSDKEVAILYALSLVGGADMKDKTYSAQKKAAEILQSLYPGQPNHPGIVHYIIHAYDSPELAGNALDAARKYAAIAPSSAHAQHMPSHIFIRLGLWDESIASNKTAAASAKCYAEGTGLTGHWDEELHAIDYLVYAYLQKGENKLAKEQVDYLGGFTKVFPVNFKVLYAFAASPARYYLENKMWKEASTLALQKGFEWEKFPWQEAIVHFTRLIGFVNLGQVDPAKASLKELEKMYEAIKAQKDDYKANQVLIQIRTGEAWIAFAEGKKEEAIQKMKEAATMEDATEKAAVTPGEVLPARQLLADMLLATGNNEDAATAYKADLAKHPNRFNSLYGAGLTNERLYRRDEAVKYYRQLIAVAGASDRVEIAKAKRYLTI